MISTMTEKRKSKRSVGRPAAEPRKKYSSTMPLPLWEQLTTYRESSRPRPQLSSVIETALEEFFARKARGSIAD